jgi:CPA1 family monovalent cation:H+ antiporter
MVVGNYGARIGMSPTTRIVLEHIWEYIAFIANSLIFLLIGLTMDLSSLVQYGHLIAWGVAATLVARAAVIYGTTWPVERFTGKLPMKWRHVLFWGGLRGAIGLALALSLPPGLGPWQDPLRVTAFGVVLFTLLVQGTTIQVLLRRLGLTEMRPRPKEYEMTKAKLYALQAAWRRLNEMNTDGVLSPSVWQRLNQEYRLAGQQLADQIQLLYDQYSDLEQQELEAAQRDALRVQRSALNDMLRRGLISDEAYRELVYEVDRQLEALGETI